MRKSVLAALVLGAILIPAALFADPIAIHGVGVSSQKLANGNTVVHFTVRVDVLAAPLVFNYHWERSDGAKSGLRMWSVKPGVSSIPVSTTWEMGPNHPAEVWERLVLNTGNTHLESQPIRIALH
jgi:hypothetical protein